MQDDVKKYMAKAVLVGVSCSSDRMTCNSDERTLAELKSLLKTAGGETAAVMVQNKETPDARTFIGSGKAQELKALAGANDATLVVFDNELSPAQIKNLEDETGLFVIDRSMLILDIFALHATTREGKLQVAMAQHKYSLPRLTGKGLELSRLGGGIGTRGPGESKLETDRRHQKERIRALQDQLDEIRKNRTEQRRTRDRADIPNVAIIGYTNAGKSTLLNTLTNAGVLAENKLFATLDPTTRKLKLENGFEMLITDTVGFIRNLPHHLIEAFASTLDEVRYADLLLIVADVSDDEMQEHLLVTQDIIGKLGAGHLPVVIALNKMDLMQNELPELENSVPISAKSGVNVDRLLQLVYRKLSGDMRTYSLLIPYNETARADVIYSASSATVLEKEYREGGTYFRVRSGEELFGRLKQFEYREQI